MGMVSIDIKCLHCKKENTRHFSWIDPKKFSNPKKAVMTASFHCGHCSMGNALKVGFLPDNKVQFLNSIDFKSLIKENAFVQEPTVTEEPLEVIEEYLSTDRD